MSRRTVAGLLALVMAVVLGAVAYSKPTPYVTFSPGPTLNVLGDYSGKSIIQISGRKTYDDGGQLRMVTIYPSGPTDDLSLLRVMGAWLDRDVAVLPKGVVYGKDDTAASVQQESALQMTTSQEDATAAALTAAGIGFSSKVLISRIEDKGASKGKLQLGDEVVAVNGTKVSDALSVGKMIRPLPAGSKVTLQVRRKGKLREIVITTRAGELDLPAAGSTTAPDKCGDDADAPVKTVKTKVSLIGVSPAEKPVFPFAVKVNLSDNIGGPSAGMMFALTIYDLLTPGSLTGGKAIAGSGEITPDGVVGPIGGIGQKLAGAQRDGAKLFLVAAENWKEAIGSHYDKSKMRLVKVHTLSEAIEDIKTWVADPKADIPECAA